MGVFIFKETTDTLTGVIKCLASAFDKADREEFNLIVKHLFDSDYIGAGFDKKVYEIWTRGIDYCTPDAVEMFLKLYSEHLIAKSFQGECGQGLI